MIIPKFKAWHKELKFMAEVIEIEFHSKMVLLENEIALDDVGGRGWFKFDEVELLQFTGLKDKTGKEVWEGDIIKAVFGNRAIVKPTLTRVFNLEVKFLPESGYFVSHPHKDKLKSCCFFMGFEKCEIVGNKFENPELLEGGE